MNGKFKISICNELRERGKKILNSEEFKKCCFITHHKKTTAGAHMFHVAYVSLAICNVLEHLHIKIDRNSVVKISLLHDIGMIHRYVKFHSKFITAFKHPLESGYISKDFGVTDKELKSIKRHMFPIYPIPPMNIEGIVLLISDKVCSFREAAGILCPYKPAMV